MKENLKKNFINNKIIIGTWLTIPDLTVTEIISGFNFDCFVIDLEHSSISSSQTLEMIRIIDKNDKNCLVRLPNLNIELIKKCLDYGANGIIIPDVRSSEEVKKIVSSCFYPPKGTRGMGLYRAQKFGEGFSKYLKASKNISVIVQIEHKEAVDKIDEILNVDGLDAIIVGPYDLSASLNIPGKFNNNKFKQNIKKIISASKIHKKSVGFHLVDPSNQGIKKLIKQKFNFIICGVDFKYLIKSLKEIKLTK